MMDDQLGTSVRSGLPFHLGADGDDEDYGYFDDIDESSDHDADTEGWQEGTLSEISSKQRTNPYNDSDDRLGDDESCCSGSSSDSTVGHTVESNPFTMDDDLGKTVREGERLHLRLCDEGEGDGYFDSTHKCNHQADVGDGWQEQEPLNDDSYPARTRTNPYDEISGAHTTGIDLDRRRVHFAPIDSSTRVISSASGDKVVRNLTWTDMVGITGRYTGKVNENMEPHGSGVMIYKDRSSRTAIWENGIPKKSWAPTNTFGSAPKPKPKKCSTKENQSLRSSATTASWCESDDDDISIGRISAGLRYDSFLPHTNLGDNPILQDMRLDSTTSKVNNLQVHDFAWIMRSDYRWTYAIVADRQDDKIRFVVDQEGSTKTYYRKYWSRSIRLVAIPPRKLSGLSFNDHCCSHASPSTVDAFHPHLKHACDCRKISRISIDFVRAPTPPPQLKEGRRRSRRRRGRQRPSPVGTVINLFG